MFVMKFNFLKNLGMFAQGEQSFKPLLVKNRLFATVDNPMGSSSKVRAGTRYRHLSADDAESMTTKDY